jgi:plasmid stabilization system protein ParE
MMRLSVGSACDGNHLVATVASREPIRDYIAQDSPQTAGLVVARIVNTVERLKVFPESGSKVPE